MLMSPNVDVMLPFSKAPTVVIKDWFNSISPNDEIDNGDIAETTSRPLASGILIVRQLDVGSSTTNAILPSLAPVPPNVKGVWPTIVPRMSIVSL